MEKKPKILLKLFISTFYLSAFTFGGGYVIVTLMKKKFVDQYRWIDEEEMLELVAIAQSAPGPIAVNGAIVVGYKLAGIAGTITAVIATILPPFLVISVISIFYEAFRDNRVVSLVLEGMQAGVAAVIASVVWEMAVGILLEKKWLSVLIMAGSLIAAACLSINAVFIILVCIAVGLLRTFAPKRKGDPS